MKNKRPFFIIGLVFTAISLFFVPFIIAFSVAFKGPNDGYDFSSIEKNGLEKDARITYIKTLYNITINGEHPVIISYEYNNNGKTKKDRFETLDLEEIVNFKIGNGIKILAYNGQTIIKGIEPYTFPIRFFSIPSALFFIFGTVFLVVALVPALKVFNLYKNGIIRDAVIMSISSASFSPSNKNGVLVSYYFFNELHNKVFGEDASTDFVLLTQKKVGDAVKIFVSETDENISCLVPLSPAIKYNWI